MFFFSLKRLFALETKRLEEKTKFLLSHLHGNSWKFFRICWRDIWIKHQSIFKWSYVSSNALNSISIEHFRMKVVIVLERKNKKNPFSNAVHMANTCVWLCHSYFYWKYIRRLCECFFCCCFDLVFNTQSSFRVDITSIIFNGMEMALVLKYAY